MSSRLPEVTFLSGYYHSEGPDMLEQTLVGLSSGTRNSLSNWLTRKQKATVCSWRIVIGFHPLVACEQDEEQSVAKLLNEPLHRIFVKFGVNVYLSHKGCISYSLRDNVAFFLVSQRDD